MTETKGGVNTVSTNSAPGAIGERWVACIAGTGPAADGAEWAPMSPDIEELRLLRRARDQMDREYARPLDVPALARTAMMSPAHFSRRFRAAYSETPYSYLMSRRIERSKTLLRMGELSVTEVCMAVGCTSLGSFSARFTELVGETPSEYRARSHDLLRAIPACQTMVITRPRKGDNGWSDQESSFREAIEMTSS
jgi:AraC-like DNA-binding protein